MPGIDHPPGKLPKKVTFSDDSFSWIDCGYEVAASTPISDWDNSLQEYVDTPNGTYRLKNSIYEITVVDGVIDSVDEA